MNDITYDFPELLHIEKSVNPVINTNDGLDVSLTNDIRYIYTRTLLSKDEFHLLYDNFGYITVKIGNEVFKFGVKHENKNSFARFKYAEDNIYHVSSFGKNNLEYKTIGPSNFIVITEGSVSSLYTLGSNESKYFFGTKTSFVKKLISLYEIGINNTDEVIKSVKDYCGEIRNCNRYLATEKYLSHKKFIFENANESYFINILHKLNNNLLISSNLPYYETYLLPWYLEVDGYTIELKYDGYRRSYTICYRKGQYDTSKHSGSLKADFHFNIRINNLNNKVKLSALVSGSPIYNGHVSFLDIELSRVDFIGKFPNLVYYLDFITGY